ncbi:MAG TPA: hypothetical protein P5287_03590 [bacterium]|nr:hypothetical protein [bacterium]
MVRWLFVVIGFAALLVYGGVVFAGGAGCPLSGGGAVAEQSDTAETAAAATDKAAPADETTAPAPAVTADEGVAVEEAAPAVSTEAPAGN